MSTPINLQYYGLYSKGPLSEHTNAFESGARHWSMDVSMTYCSMLCQTFNRRCRKISRWCQYQMKPAGLRKDC